MAGMLAVGFKGVIGTMWSIWDNDTPIIVEAYYRKLLELRKARDVGPGYMGATYTLHEATKVLRAVKGPRRWGERGTLGPVCPFWCLSALFCLRVCATRTSFLWMWNRMLSWILRSTSTYIGATVARE